MLQDIPKYSPNFENPVYLTAVEIPCHLLTLVINSSYSTIFVEILCDYRSRPIDSSCMRILAIISRFLEFVFSAQTSFRTWAGSQPIQPWSIMQLSLFRLLVLFARWSTSHSPLCKLQSLCILYFGLFRCSHNPMYLHSFFPRWTLMWSHWFNPCIVSPHGLLDSFWGIIIRPIPSYPKNLWVLVLVHNALANCTPYLIVVYELAFELVSFDSVNLLDAVSKMPQWVVSMLLPSVWTRKFSRVILFWYFTSYIFQTQNVS